MSRIAVVTSRPDDVQWLAHEPPNLAESRAAVQRIIAEGTRASEVIQRCGDAGFEPWVGAEVESAPKLKWVQ